MKIPKTCLTLMFSPYNIAPTNIKAIAKQIFATSAPELTFHPARYMKIYPSSSPTIAIPKTIEVQLTLDNSKIAFSGFTKNKNITPVNIAAVI